MLEYVLFVMVLATTSTGVNVKPPAPGNVLLFGGTCGLNQIVNPLANTSSQFETKGVPSLYSSRAVVIQRHNMNGRVFVIGGAEQGGDPEPTVWVWDADSGEVGSVTNMSTARIHHTATNMGNDNNIIVCGGMNACSKELASCEMYDVTYDMWTAVPDIPTGPRRVHAAVAISGGTQGTRRLFIAGGMDPHLSTALIFDYAVGRWSTAANLLQGRYAHSMAEYNHGNNVLVCGGANTLDAYTNCESYDVQNDVWSPLASMEIARMGASIVHGHSLGFTWIIGGMDDNDNQLMSIEAFDLEHNATTNYGSQIMTPCSFMTAIVF